MSKQKLSTKIKRALQGYRNAPLYLATGVVAICVEFFSAGGISIENQATARIFGFSIPLAYPEMVLSVSMTLTSLMLMGAAASQKSDPRPAQQKRAGSTQTLAIVVLIAPVFYAGSCVALNTQTSEWQAYHGSAAERADEDLAAGRSADGRGVDSMVMQNAAEDLKEKGVRPVHPDLMHLIPAMAWIALLLGCNMLAVRLGWRPKKETSREATARIYAERAAKAQATAEKNRKAAEREARKGQTGGRWSVLQGGQS